MPAGVTRENAPLPTFGRLAEIGSVALSVRRILRSITGPLALVLACTTAFLWLSGNTGTNAFAAIAIGTLVILWSWQAYGAGLPVVPLLAIQNLLLYGLPVVTENATVFRYSETLLTLAGTEILVFSVAMAATWRFGIASISFGSRFCYALQGFSDDRMVKLSKLGFALAGAATLYQVLHGLDLLTPLLEALPAGSGSIITAVVSGATACGFFLAGMVVGTRAVSANQRLLFWFMLVVNCFILAAGFLLSSTTTIILSVGTGLFWSTGRMPWKFFVTSAALLGFFNLGKFEMRDRYWAGGEDAGWTKVSFGEMPGYYREWAEASLATLTDSEAMSKKREQRENESRLSGVDQDEGQSLLDRINNLQNVLFVIDAVQNRRVPLLDGATYTLIPPLLVPRILWPNKPRSHEGQVLLNVHYGRQELRATFRTYIAWGLQAEAYGNFGAILGNAILGGVLGLLFAWLEKYGARKLLLSLEGFLSFVLFLGIANSFEMVASVLVTSLYQAFIPVVLATLPFVERVLPAASPKAGAAT